MNRIAVASANAFAPLPHELDSSRRPEAARAIRQLRRRGINNADIRALVEALREDAGMHEMTSTWPSAGEARATLKEVQTHARALRESLRALSPLTTQSLDLTMKRMDPDSAWIRPLTKTLETLIYAARDRERRTPTQSRRRSRAGVIARVHQVASRHGIEPSPAVGSAFHDVCLAAFALAGVTSSTRADGTSRKTTDPAAAIRAYQKRVAPSPGQ